MNTTMHPGADISHAACCRASQLTTAALAGPLARAASRVPAPKLKSCSTIQDRTAQHTHQGAHHITALCLTEHTERAPICVSVLCGGGGGRGPHTTTKWKHTCVPCRSWWPFGIWYNDSKLPAACEVLVKHTFGCAWWCTGQQGSAATQHACLHSGCYPLGTVR